MLPRDLLLKHYSKPFVMEAIFNNAENKEVVGSFQGKGYGKRPDTLEYPSDILELVKKGITSFHVSEEIWNNPLALNPGLKKKDVDELRQGWDLLLDIDCPYWEFAKLTTYLFIEALKRHGITAITCKFSGNKGFHIGVPFEAFPKLFREKETKLLFPEAPRKIAKYLLHYITENLVKIDSDYIYFDKYKYTFEQIKKITEKSIEELTNKFCTKCKSPIEDKSKSKSEFVCECGHRETSDFVPYKMCPKCNSIIKPFETKTPICDCGSADYETRFDPTIIVEVDTILISTRHLCRMVYSFHEKSGLVSVPIDPFKILNFNKEQANPEPLKEQPFSFLERNNLDLDQAANLMVLAYDFTFDDKKDNEHLKKSLEKEFEIPKSAIPDKFFPPCIDNIMKGMKDGKKRGIFILINYLSSIGYSFEAIEGYIRKFNVVCDDELREVYWKGQLRHAQQKKKVILPPNCDNKMYYQDLGICTPDGFCPRIKNPVQYSTRKVFLQQQNEPKRANKKNKEEEGTEKHS
jgi:hypothetical protein